MIRLLASLAVALVLAGCQTDVVSPLMPLPLPVEPMPTTKLTVVAIGDTAEAARQEAINQLVRQVILPPTTPEQAPTDEFVRSMIRGYNVARIAQDFRGKYYVTIELTISQLGLNYQELYHVNELARKQVDFSRKDADNEEQQRKMAEAEQQALHGKLEAQRLEYEKRILALTAELEKLRNAPAPR
jgi:hypothetical protein